MEEKSLEAVDAYVDNIRVLGNSILSQARDSIVAIDKILVAHAGDLRAKIQATQTIAAAKEAAVARITIMVIVLAAAFAALLTMIIILSISGQLKSLTEAMSVLAEGDHTVYVVGAGRKDEIGKMAQAVQVFKDNAIVREHLESESKMQREQAETGREERQKLDVERQQKEMEETAKRQQDESERERAAAQADEQRRLESAQAEERQKRQAEEERTNERIKPIGRCV